jgi:hypothetical protein
MTTWTASTAFTRTREAAERAGCRITGNGRQLSATCPSHDDRKASLRIADGEDRVLVYCQAHCELDDILGKLAMTRADLFDAPLQRAADDDWAPWQMDGGCPCPPAARYDYVDEIGKLLFQVVRGQHKEFSQRRPDPSSRSGWRWHLDDTRRVLFHLPQLLAAPSSACVFLAEGEKDVLALEAAGEIATCNPGGALKGEGRKSWQPAWTEVLIGRDVLIVADQDPAGRIHAQHVAESIDGHARFWWIVQAANGKDAADHLAAGRAVTDFVWWSE